MEIGLICLTLYVCIERICRTVDLALGREDDET